MTTNVVWGAAAISIILVSWGFYRLVLPKAAREWARAGLVQAFIIAFYAEMYGFPVTVYLLTRILNLRCGEQFLGRQSLGLSDGHPVGDASFDDRWLYGRSLWNHADDRGLA